MNQDVDIYTETMAEVYADQGHWEKVADIYRHLLATEPELLQGRFTGKVSGIPCFQEGKVKRLKQWLKQEGLNPHETWFYSDSHNDLPLLKAVDNPVAVDPDEELANIARQSNWRQISLR